MLTAFFAACVSFTLNAQTIYTVAGNGTAAYGGDGGPATLSQVNDPHGVATDAAGNVYISDYENHRIRKISTTGVITTIAGTGFGAYDPTQDGGPATAAWIKWPTGIAVDPSGNVYFSDMGNNRIRKISTSGIITTIAGTLASGYGGDGGPATAAQLFGAWGVAIDLAGNVLIADQLNNRIRKVNMATGIITTIAGMGFTGFGGDGGPATSSACKLNEPTGVAVDGAGNIYIADNSNNRVRKINTSGIISTIAGIGLPYGYTGDGGPASIAKLYYPKGIAADNAGNVYICDWNNNAIRKINTSGIINTIAGTGVAGFTGDGMAAVSTQLNQPTGVAVRYDGDVFIADNFNNRVRRIKIGNEPYFTWGVNKSLLFCPTESVFIDSVLKVDDIDVGQTLAWSPVMLPAHGTLVVTCTATTTGSTVTPVGAAYSPVTGYIGLDTFTVRVNDGTYSDTIKIFVTIPGAPTGGIITGADTICPGHSVTLTDAVTGGAWSCSSPSIASVSAGGVVSGITPGTATITYTVTNLCGTAYATRTVTVLATVPCITNVTGPVRSTNGDITILPNPNNGSFTINIYCDMPQNATVEIYNVLGSRVSQNVIPTGQPIDIYINQPTGIYFVCICMKDKMQTEKIVITK